MEIPALVIARYTHRLDRMKRYVYHKKWIENAIRRFAWQLYSVRNIDINCRWVGY